MTLQLYDLGQITAIVLASMTGVMAFFQLVRTLFLDNLVKGRLDAKQQNTLYHVLIWGILTVMITALAMMNYYSLSITLVVSAGAAAIPITAGVNFVYTRIQQPQPPTAVSAPTSDQAGASADSPAR